MENAPQNLKGRPAKTLVTKDSNDGRFLKEKIRITKGAGKGCAKEIGKASKGPVNKTGFTKGLVYRPKPSSQLIEVPVISARMDPFTQQKSPTTSHAQITSMYLEGSFVKEGSTSELKEVEVQNREAVIQFHKEPELVSDLRILPGKRGYSELDLEQGDLVQTKRERRYGTVQTNDVGSSAVAIEQPCQT
jgi:hypothetical protein